MDPTPRDFSSGRDFTWTPEGPKLDKPLFVFTSAFVHSYTGSQAIFIMDDMELRERERGKKVHGARSFPQISKAIIFPDINDVE